MVDSAEVKKKMQEIASDQGIDGNIVMKRVPWATIGVPENNNKEFLMTEGLGAKYLERKVVIEAEIKRLESELKKGADYQADLQRKHSDVGRQLQEIQALLLKQSGKLEAVNEAISDMKGDVTPTIPKNGKKKA